MHDHHRRSAARALQLGAFAQWWLRSGLHAPRAGRHRAGLVHHAQQRQPLAVLAIRMERAKVASAPQLKSTNGCDDGYDDMHGNNGAARGTAVLQKMRGQRARGLEHRQERA